MTYTIVVGVNDSIPSRIAVAWAAARAAVAGGAGEVVLVHVLGTVPDLPEETVGEIRAAAAGMLRDAEEEAVRAHPSVRARTELREGELIDELLAAAADADLIVVGTHKTGFIRGRSIGSRSLRIAAEARIPVAVIPESAYRSRSGIVVGVEESRGGVAALEFAAEEAERTGQEITLIRAWDAPRSVGTDFEITVSDLERRYAADAERALREGTEIIRRGFPNLVTRSRRVRRPVAEALLDSAASASVLVIGETYHGSSRLPVGEVGHDVLMNLVGPTVLVHPPALPARDVVQSDSDSGRKLDE